MRSLNTLLSSEVPLEDLWPFLAKFTSLFESCPDSVAEFAPDFAEALIRKIEQIRPES